MIMSINCIDQYDVLLEFVLNVS